MYNCIRSFLAVRIYGLLTTALTHIRPPPPLQALSGCWLVESAIAVRFRKSLRLPPFLLAVSIDSAQ